MVQSYKKKPQLAEQYDVIVIGSGMGGLTLAALLTKAGKKVLVLERHYTAGGFTHIFKRKGYEWDVGIHYIGEMHRKHGPLRKMFDYITDGQLTWADMGEVYDKIVIGDRHYDLVKGVGNFKEKMIGYFPDEEEAIETYVDLVFKANRTSRNFYLEKAMPPLLSKLSGNRMRGPFLKYATQTTRQVLESLTQNEELIKVLTGQYGDYGLPPAESSFAMHASLVKHYFGGGYFPIGGSARLVETIDPVLEAGGSTILISAPVKEIMLEGKKAVGVRMEDGKEFKAPIVVSGAGIINTYEKLLPESLANQLNLKSQLKQINPSAAHLCLYTGFKGDPQSLNLPKTNYWIYPSQGTHEENISAYLQDMEQEFPLVYLSFPAAKDPDWTRRYPDRSTVDIITLAPYEEFEKWEGSSWKKRGEDYDTFKEKLSQRLLETLFQHLPHLRERLDYYELSTPLTTRHFVNYDKGEIYGLDHSPSRFSHKFLRPQTPIKNLWLTGQDVVTAGIGGALFSGLLTASAITRKNFMKEVMESHFPSDDFPAA
ncbi:MAG: NAD(P)/FAD-dependent oxidoreductase [Bacteroidota bacterium]